MIDISKLLEEIQASPYKEVIITAPHSGVVSFPDLPVGSKVIGPSGQWKEKEGTVLATLERERNPRSIHSAEKGELTLVHKELSGTFVQAGTELAKIRHYMSKDEVLSVILKKALFLFEAPERAKYYFTPAIDVKINVAGAKSVTVYDGMDLFIMSRMKRESPLAYSGPDGVIYAIYFTHNENMDIGQPLIGVCPPDMVRAIEDVVMRVQSEWREED